jgi:hypothetical protein
MNKKLNLPFSLIREKWIRLNKTGEIVENLGWTDQGLGTIRYNGVITEVKPHEVSGLSPEETFEIEKKEFMNFSR